MILFFFVWAQPALIWWFITAVHYLQTWTDRSLIHWVVLVTHLSSCITAASENPSKIYSADWQPGHVALESFCLVWFGVFLWWSKRVHKNYLDVTGTKKWRPKAVRNRDEIIHLIPQCETSDEELGAMTSRWLRFAWKQTNFNFRQSWCGCLVHQPK